LARGVHFFVWRRYGVTPFQHHAIDLGDGNAIHFSDGRNGIAGPSSDPVHFTVAKIFLPTLTRNGTDKIHLVAHSVSEGTIEEVVARAKSQLGRRGYHLFHDTCEHFASWCVTGHAKSCQVTAAAERASSVATKTTLAVSSRIAVKSFDLMKPWGLAADMVQFSTEVVGHRFGLVNPNTRKKTGRALGGTTAIVIGAIGGPAGIAIAGGAWFLGELSGEVTARAISTHQLRRKRQPTTVTSSSTFIESSMP